MHQTFSSVICVLNSKYIHSSLAPWCLLAGVEFYCIKSISAQVVEGTINEDMEKVAKRIIEKEPNVIAFSCYIWNISQTKKLIQLVKQKLPDTVIVLGGPEVSYCAEEVLQTTPLADYILSGEGEKPFAMLLNAIHTGNQIEEVPGLSYRKGKTVVVSEPYLSQEEPPSPYSKAYLDALRGRIAYLETSRGCPYSCAFCLSGRCGTVRFYNMERAKKELLLLANSGTQTVKLVDRTFNANRKRANEIFQFIIENYGTAIPKGICFHFEIAGDLLDDETIALIGKAPIGSMQFEIGLQSFNPKTLIAIHRKTNVEHLKNNIQKMISNANCHIHIDLIAGLPYEDMNSFAKSFNIAYALQPNMLQLGFLKLLYGAPMREKPEDFPCSYSKEPPYEVCLTPWLSAQELKSLHDTEDALERFYNSGRFRNTLSYVLQQTGKSPFDFFYDFGHLCAEKSMAHISLNEYTAIAYDYLCTLSGIQKEVLRDKMVCDRLTTNSTGKLAPILHRENSLLKKVVIALNGNEKTAPKNGIKRGIAILATENCAVYVDYENKNPITGAYPLNRIPLSDIKTLE